LAQIGTLHCRDTRAAATSLNVFPVSARTGSVSANFSIRRKITSQYAGEISQP